MIKKTLQEKYSQLNKEKSALLATNFYNVETLQGVLRAAKQTTMPLILQTSPSTISYLGAHVAAQLAKASLKQMGVEGWLHLDHAESFDLIKECLDEGYDSVMIDASKQSFEENVKITKKVVKLAEQYGASVEAELGYIAKPGEDSSELQFTNPEQARNFVDTTGIDALAVAIGSAHGFYDKEPNLQIDLLRQIDEATPCALVLHGSSGIPSDQIRAGIRSGIRKINIATEMKNIFMQTLKQELADSDNIDLRKVFPPATEQITSLVIQKLENINNA